MKVDPVFSDPGGGRAAPPARDVCGLTVCGISLLACGVCNERCRNLYLGPRGFGSRCGGPVGDTLLLRARVWPAAWRRLPCSHLEEPMASESPPRSPPAGGSQARRISGESQSPERSSSPTQPYSPTRLKEGVHRVVVRPAFTQEDELKMVEISNGDIVRVDGVVREVKWLEITGVRDVSGRIQSVEPWYKGKVKLEAGGGEFRNPGSGILRNAESCRALQGAGLQFGMETKIMYPAGPPQRLVLRGNTAVQHMCLGIYVLVIGHTWNDTAVWRHASEDRCICLSNVNDPETGEAIPMWCVARALTFGLEDGKLQRCMQLPAKFNAEGNLVMPNNTKGTWQEWTGRSFVPCKSARCRATTHGWGQHGEEYNRVAHTHRLQHNPKKFPPRPIA